MSDDDELPRDPDMDSVPEELELLAGLDRAVTVLDEDGVSRDQLVIALPLFVHARRLGES